MLDKKVFFKTKEDFIKKEHQSPISFISLNKVYPYIFIIYWSIISNVVVGHPKSGSAPLVLITPPTP